MIAGTFPLVYVRPEKKETNPYRKSYIDNNTLYVSVIRNFTFIKLIANYHFNEILGTLTVNLKPECFLEHSIKAASLLIAGVDALLSVFAVTFFNIHQKVIGLLNGQIDHQQLEIIPGSHSTFYCNHYDDKEEIAIDYAQVADFAFDKSSYKLNPSGTHFKLNLKPEYRNHPSVLYAIHDVLQRLKITRLTQP